MQLQRTQIQINSPKTHTQGKKRKYPSTKKNKQTNKKSPKPLNIIQEQHTKPQGSGHTSFGEEKHSYYKFSGNL